VNKPRLLLLIALMLLLAAGVWFDRSHQRTGGQPMLSADSSTSKAIALGVAPSRLPRSELPGTGNPLGGWPSGALAEVIDRPLFNPTRRGTPAPLPAKAADKPQPVDAGANETLDITLNGLLIGQSGRFALLRRQSTGAVIWVRESQKFDSHTLERVDPLEAVLVGPSGRHTLKVFEPVPPTERSAGTASQPDDDDEVDHEYD
jgi:hypothetical protein